MALVTVVENSLKELLECGHHITSENQPGYLSGIKNTDLLVIYMHIYKNLTKWTFLQEAYNLVCMKLSSYEPKELLVQKYKFKNKLKNSFAQNGFMITIFCHLYLGYVCKSVYIDKSVCNCLAYYLYCQVNIISIPALNCFCTFFRTAALADRLKMPSTSIAMNKYDIVPYYV